MASSWARCTTSEIFERAASVTDCHAVASLTLRWYCCVPATSPRRVSARLVPYGSSEARVICLPDDIRCCVLARLFDTSFRSLRTEREIMLLVMRVDIRDPPPLCG